MKQPKRRKPNLKTKPMKQPKKKKEKLEEETLFQFVVKNLI